MESIVAASAGDIAAVEGFGPIIAEAVHAWFADSRALELVGRLESAGLTMEAARVDESLPKTLDGLTRGRVGDARRVHP